MSLRGHEILAEITYKLSENTKPDRALPLTGWHRRKPAVIELAHRADRLTCRQQSDRPCRAVGTISKRKRSSLATPMAASAKTWH
jgi:hypothetical protein